MSPTPGYGETPLDSDPEQPAWLRKSAAAPSSGRPYASAQPEGGLASETSSPASSASVYDSYGNPPRPTYPQPPQSPYQGAPPAQYQGHEQYPAQYPAPYPAPRPGAYPPPGWPWGPVDPQSKSRLVAGLLGIFLGALGIHRFYLGYTGVGVAMLLMTLLSFGLFAVVTSIWGLVEGILYLTAKTGRYSHDATGRPLRD